MWFAEAMEQKTTKAVALRRLSSLLAEIPELTQLQHDSQTFANWHRKTGIAITNVFGNKTSHRNEFGNIGYRPSLSEELSARTADPYQEAYLRGLKSAKALLESMIEEIDEYWADGSQAPTSSVSGKEKRTNANEAFIIHGRDEGTKETVARILERLKLKPVILAEQASHGRTIIENWKNTRRSGLPWPC